MKRLVLFVLVIMMCMIFAACGSAWDSNTPSESLTTPDSSEEQIKLSDGNSVGINSTEPQDSSEQDSKYQFVNFGSYEQDNDESNGKESIEWIIIDENDENTLLISKHILDRLPFNSSTIANATDWENSSLRTYLNSDFFESAFSDDEQALIVPADVQDYKTDHVLGEVTRDHVFLLSYDQAWSYFPTESERLATLTEYARTKGKYASDSYWLIDSYTSDLYKRLVNPEGFNKNNPRVNESEGVRPVIWVKSSALK